jgi:hypothetical protein
MTDGANISMHPVIVAVSATRYLIQV